MITPVPKMVIMKINAILSSFFWRESKMVEEKESGVLGLKFASLWKKGVSALGI